MATRLASLILSLWAIVRCAHAWDEPPKPPRVFDTPIPIFLHAPSDLNAFWKQLSKPDFVLLDGELYQQLKQATVHPTNRKDEGMAVTESLVVTGEVEGDWARLIVEIGVVLAGDGPLWTPIHLDGMTLGDVRDDSGDIPTRIGEGRRWEVELTGRGRHALRIILLAPVRSSVVGRKLSLAVPPCASTRVDLAMTGSVIEASAGPGEMLEVSHQPDRPAARLVARLKPRSQLDLVWSDRVDPSLKLPTLLSAQGEISLEIEKGSIRSRSSWVIGSIRGIATELTMHLDPAEVPLDLEVDGRPVLGESSRDAARSSLLIPLVDPLRPGSTRSVLLNTKRPISSTGQVRVSIQGYALAQAKVQGGVIAVAKTGPLFIDSSAGPGLRRIDPRTELPESLRSRQDTSLAFDFNDQPFDLNLVAEPAPPRVRVESRSTITIDARSLQMQTWLDCRISQGHVFDICVLVPPGLNFDGVEPAEIVESSRVVPIGSLAQTPMNPVEVTRMLTVSLTPKSRESNFFSILLKGSASVDPSKLVEIPVFRPMVDTDAGGRLVVVSDRNVSVDLAEREGFPAKFRLTKEVSPVDWAWPGQRPGSEMGLLWLRSDADPAALPLHVSARSRSFRHESTISASVDLKGVEVVEEIGGEVSFGVLSRLDLSLPADVPALWQVEGVEVTGRETIGLGTDGSRRVRLNFARDLDDAFRLRIRYRIPFPVTPSLDRAARIQLAAIRVMEGTSTGRKAVIKTVPSLETRAEGQGWSPISSFENPDSEDSEWNSGVSFILKGVGERSGPIELMIQPGPPSPLPGVLVSKLWLKTIQRNQGDWFASAKLRVESRDGMMTIALAPGSRLIRVKTEIAELEEGRVTSDGNDQYRIHFADADHKGPNVLMVDYEVPAATGTVALEVVNGGIVQETMWEVQVPGNRAGLGTPTGWIDENEWYWEGLIWRRRPRRSPLELASWLAGAKVTSSLGETLESGERVGRQSYLFSRIGPPNASRFPTYSRLLLLLLFSGPVLAAGLLVLARRPSPRSVSITTLLLVFSLASLLESNVLLIMLQSSFLGMILWLSAVVIHWAIERMGHVRSPGGGVLVPTMTVGSTLGHPPMVGSEDSTAIRLRPASQAASTADHVVLSRPLEDTPGDLSTSEPGLG